MYSKARVHWLRRIRRMSGIDSSASLHYTVQIATNWPGQIEVGPKVRIDCDTWINIPYGIRVHRPLIRIGASACIGRRNVISARNGIDIAEACLTGPQVLIMDHAHEFSDPDVPVVYQGVTEGGRIVLERGCWIGFGAVILCSRGELRVGQNAVVGANSVVTKSVPPRSVVVGNPARVIRQYHEEAGAWLALPADTPA